MTVLGPSVVIFPAILVFHPSMAPFLHPDRDQTEEAAVSVGGTPPPIVMVIFDQLPLTSLMASDGTLDADWLPGFASLAADATWYRNASTAAELTGWAIPPILTGIRPRPSRLPIARDYPNNLFTLLGDSYRMEVEEPITDLCPERLCPSDGQSGLDRLIATAIDAGVVYLHVVLPLDLRAMLPPLTQDWKNFLQSQQFQQRWVSERDRDRREGPRQFIESIRAGDHQPTLYYLHALLPHEPYIYLRSGQQFTDHTSLPGLLGTGRWVDQAWPVIQAYRRHLVQVGLVDSLVGQIVDRLKGQGLWDRALVVVTADHGVSFRPGHPFKGLDGSTLPDIMTVPLFVKLPGQHGPAVDDSNVQSIDVLPTIADVLDVTPPWQPDGSSALVRDRRPPTKLIQHTAATKSIEIGVADLARLRDQAVARRARLFGDPTDPDLVPTTTTHHELIGQAVANLNTGDTDDASVVISESERYTQLDPAAPTLPALLSGQALDDYGRPLDVRLAVAVNGVVRATTETYSQAAGQPGTWSAFVAPRHWRAGRNDIEVYRISDADKQVRLDEVYSLRRRPEWLNLASRGAAEDRSVAQDGLYAREGSTDAFRWTNGAARLRVPLTGFVGPKSLRIRDQGDAAGRHSASPHLQRLHAVRRHGGPGTVVPDVLAGRVPERNPVDAGRTHLHRQPAVQAENAPGHPDPGRGGQHAEPVLGGLAAEQSRGRHAARRASPAALRAAARPRGRGDHRN